MGDDVGTPLQPLEDPLNDPKIASVQFTGSAPALGAVLTDLAHLGWGETFQAHVPEDCTHRPMRVMAVHRSTLDLAGEEGALTVPFIEDVTVGDWLLVDLDLPGQSQRLERKSLFKRKAPGHGHKAQLIAANVDTGFIVTSCNADFNLARLERYVALAFEAGVDPVILLTKADLCKDPEPYVSEAQSISERVPVVALNAKSSDPIERLAPWCQTGQTIAFLGSSGVGKSTLVNALSGTIKAETQAIRDADSKGRHTTTHRQLYVVAQGYAVMDTPGMRELQLMDTQSGLAEVFEDIHALAEGCRFNDCKHETEPGCAVRAALEAGTLDAGRFERWRKLIEEDTQNSATPSERRAAGRSLRKRVKAAQRVKRR